MDIAEIITNSIDNYIDSKVALDCLIQYLDTDTLVSWFVDNDLIDDLDDEEAQIIRDYYDRHC